MHPILMPMLFMHELTAHVMLSQGIFTFMCSHAGAVDQGESMQVPQPGPGPDQEGTELAAVQHPDGPSTAAAYTDYQPTNHSEPTNQSELVKPNSLHVLLLRNLTRTCHRLHCNQHQQQAHGTMPTA
jgi:hypothetical protein